MTAVQLQGSTSSWRRKYVEDRFGADADEQTMDVLERWESVLTRLERDPMLCASELDWVAKLKLLKSLPRPGRPRLGGRQAAADRPAVRRHPTRQGAVQQAGRSGRVDRLLTDEEIAGRGAPTRRRTPGPTSVAGAWRSTPTGSPPRPGTR